MNAVQDIVKEIISQVSVNLSANTGQIVTGAGIAIKDVEGQVVTAETDQYGARPYIGIDDSKGSYFYIRLNGAISEPRKAANTKRGSCAVEMAVRVPLKLVFQHRCADAFALLDAVKWALFNVKFSGVQWQYDIILPQIYSIQSEVLPWVVYQSETGKDPKTLNSLLKIVSVDFELRFDFTYNEKCKPYKFC